MWCHICAHDQTLAPRRLRSKFLSVDAINDPMARTHILTEARTISALNHPNICTIYEVGEADGAAVPGDGIHRRATR